MLNQESQTFGIANISTRGLRNIKLCLGFRVQGLLKTGPFNVGTGARILKHFT